ncbi:MAG TPA: winged helix DNA-binding domain-containing protein [Actinomycetes bacterium]|nr:winged helix DNA-binding domain-containing protein [Actinomycetes bacterium]
MDGDGRGTLDGADVAQRRLRNQRLSGAPFERPAEVVGWLGAVQSQDYGPAKWSVGQRIAGAADAMLDRALADGTILRTHVLRPTWHFVLPEDIRWMLELTGPRVHAQNAYHYRRLGLDAATLEACDELLAAALRGGRQRTRKDLAAALGDAGVDAGGLRLVYILMHAELNGVVCSGALRGRQHTYALLDERAPQARRRTRDEALAELTLCYFTGHGPATARDLRWWSSLTAADVADGLELVGPRLRREVADGMTYWSAGPGSGPEPGAREPAGAVHLLQGFDEYVVGYQESRYVLDLSGSARAISGERPVFNHVVVLDGQVAGHWRRTLKSGGVAIEAALYRPPDGDRRRALQAAADRHGAFLGLPATLATRTL